MGQHFLVSQAVLHKIIQAVKPEGKTILEIGAGTGILTWPLAAEAKEVIAVEKDPQLAAILGQKIEAVKMKNVHVVVGDILKLYPASLKLPAKYSAVGNIPYYLTSRLLRQLLESSHPPHEIFFTIQREVAERITAQPPHMNLLALAVQLHGGPRVLFAVSRKAFRPRPKVDSAFMAITAIAPRKLTRIREQKPIFVLARAAFRTRRKTLLNSLTINLKVSRDKIREVLQTAGVDPQTRPETLGLEQWLDIAKQWPD